MAKSENQKETKNCATGTGYQWTTAVEDVLLVTVPLDEYRHLLTQTTKDEIEIDRLTNEMEERTNRLQEDLNQMQLAHEELRTQHNLLTLEYREIQEWLGNNSYHRECFDKWRENRKDAEEE